MQLNDEIKQHLASMSPEECRRAANEFHQLSQAFSMAAENHPRGAQPDLGRWAGGLPPWVNVVVTALQVIGPDVLKILQLFQQPKPTPTPTPTP